MILDSRKASTPDTFSAPIAIVGAGAAGLSVAITLERLGVESIVIEGGTQRIDRAAQDLYRAAAIGPDPHGPAETSRIRVLGGTTAIWGGRCVPFDPIDFEHRDWIAHSGWPIGPEEVDGYLAGATALCEAGLPDYTSHEAFLCGEAHPPAEGGDVVLDRVARYSPPIHFGRHYRRQLAESSRIRVLLGANATEILTEGEGRAVRGIRARTLDGRTLEITARRVVLALGGLETPRLMLASRGERPGGVGNDHDLVGRFYQSHIEGDLGHIRFDSVRDAEQMMPRLSPDGVYLSRYIWLSPQAQRRERVGNFVLRLGRDDAVDPHDRAPLKSAAFLVKSVQPAYASPFNPIERRSLEAWRGRQAGLYGRHVRNVIAGLPAVARASLRKLRRSIVRGRRRPYWDVTPPLELAVEFNAEQVPDPDNRVLLARDTDALGMPRIDLRWSLTAPDREMISRSCKLMRTALAAHGGAQLSFDDRLADDSALWFPADCHHLGTTRMSDSPQTGVVDRNCEVFGVSGLFVAGSSVFTTSGFANPTLMLMALAMRLGEHLSRLPL